MRARTADLEASIRQHHDAIGRPTFTEISSGIASWCSCPWEKLGHTGPLLGVGLTLVAALAGPPSESQTARKNPGRALADWYALPMPRVHIYEAKHLIFLQPVLLIALCGSPDLAENPRPPLRGRRPRGAELRGFKRLLPARIRERKLARACLRHRRAVGARRPRALQSGLHRVCLRRKPHDRNDGADAETLLEAGDGFCKGLPAHLAHRGPKRGGPAIARVPPALAARGWKPEQLRSFPVCSANYAGYCLCGSRRLGNLEIRKLGDWKRVQWVTESFSQSPISQSPKSPDLPTERNPPP